MIYLQAVQLGLVQIDKQPAASRHGRQWMRVAKLFQQKLTNIEQSKYLYIDSAVRSVVAALFKSDASDQRRDSLTKLMGSLIGQEIDLDKLYKDEVAGIMQRWEEITGLEFGSPELDAAVDRAVAAIEGK